MDQQPSSVCMVIPWLDQIIGGCELQALSLCQAYQKLGQRTFVLTSYSKDCPSYEKRQGIDIYRIPFLAHQRCFFLRVYLNYLFNYKLKSFPSVFHFHNRSEFVERVLHINQQFRVPTFLKITTDYDILHLKKEFKSEAKSGKMRSQLYGQVDRYVSLNPNMQSEMILFGIDPSRILLLSNGVDCQRFSPISDSKKRQLKKELGFSPDQRLITFTGRFQERKRMVDLIYAWARIAPKHPQHQLVLIGDGEEKHTCERLCEYLNIAHRVTFIGTIPHVEQFLRITDLFVFPSRLEGLPNVVLEAMASELPILSTNISGIKEVIEHGKTGHLVPPLSVEALSEALEFLLLNQAYAKELGIAARKKALNTYEFGIVAARYLEAYQTLDKLSYARN